MSKAPPYQVNKIGVEDFSRSVSIQLNPKTGLANSKSQDSEPEAISAKPLQKEENRFSEHSIGSDKKGLDLDGLSPMSIKRRLEDAIRKTRHMPFVIGIAGGTNAGKKGLCKQIISHIEDKQSVAVLSMDQFYVHVDLSQKNNLKEYNYDHPDAIDVDLLTNTLKLLKTGQQAEVPIYDQNTGQRLPKCQVISRSDVIMVEGILVLHIKEIRELCNMKIFVDADDDVRLGQRVSKDVLERGRSPEDVINYYVKYVKPSFERFIVPSKQFADIIVPQNKGTKYSPVAIDLITGHLKQKMKTSDLRRVYPNLVLPDQGNQQIKRLHTLIRDKNTNKQDFVFYADQLNRIVVESALGLLPFKRKEVTTPTDSVYIGVDFHKGICGVSIIQSGESMENALRACCQGIKIGKILVLSEGVKIQDLEPNIEEKLYLCDDVLKQKDVVYQKLPPDIAQRYVLLMDPVLTTGEGVEQAVEVLLNCGVKDINIILITLISAPEGISHIFSLYPNITLVTSEIDVGLDQNQTLMPGCGTFGDRYFAE